MEMRSVVGAITSVIPAPAFTPVLASVRTRESTDRCRLLFVTQGRATEQKGLPRQDSQRGWMK